MTGSSGSGEIAFRPQRAYSSGQQHRNAAASSLKGKAWVVYVLSFKALSAKVCLLWSFKYGLLKRIIVWIIGLLDKIFPLDQLAKPCVYNSQINKHTCAQALIASKMLR